MPLGSRLSMLAAGLVGALLLSVGAAAQAQSSPQSPPAGASSAPDTTAQSETEVVSTGTTNMT